MREEKNLPDDKQEAREPEEHRPPVKPAGVPPERMGGEPPCKLHEFWDVDDDDQ